MAEGDLLSSMHEDGAGNVEDADDEEDEVIKLGAAEAEVEMIPPPDVA